ncbi:hypothetical protein NP493_62g02006 [Ridgeia piscesae]|uniref:Uncharacterized protein n=1 Tax=Ridgeia piscesae TaxID=27915 RepID=A0AAD9UIY2_RIDPI|nr:hypothetical protein NP493_62g02006 [Ridgeia piscesae]
MTSPPDVTSSARHNGKIGVVIPANHSAAPTVKPLGHRPVVTIPVAPTSLRPSMSGHRDYSGISDVTNELRSRHRMWWRCNRRSSYRVWCCGVARERKTCNDIIGGSRGLDWDRNDLRTIPLSPRMLDLAVRYLSDPVRGDVSCRRVLVQR